ncbi:phosphoglycolate phosphatase [Pseudobutyrivibrio sp. ACV-2]|uniref:HAD family hydrolase n=1 Tax=Pseudobutyrivibrio sp. ACV-2 TaxID=1520801 RepID=UPI0008941F7F|nr:HAD family hydrolase [Pseudobutyrivibrio sp. ACV-2]SEA90686.1 phosphoglycolate phosphatase [Pseudobutyrivibrio sp. ACV-2]
MSKVVTDGIIFDMDGTIWDNTPVFASSWTRAAKDRGYDVEFTAETLQGLFGKTMTDIADACIPDEDPEKRYETLRMCEEYEMADLAVSDVDTTYPGLEDVLKELSKDINLYIVSNCQAGYIETFLERSGFSSYFKDYICYGDNGLGKADNIKGLVEKNNIKRPVYVGDIQSDKDACDKAGVDFIWAAYGYGKSIDSCIADIHDITELLSCVEKASC